MNIMTSNAKTSSISNVKITTIKVLIAVLLIEALVWAAMILFNQPSTSSYSYSTSSSLTTKFSLMFWVIAEILIVSILAFRCMEKEQGISRILAIVGLASCALGVVLQLAMIWELIGFVESNGMFTVGISVMGKFMLVATVTTASAISGALVSIIEENGESIGLLKHIALGCGIGCWAVAMFVIFAGTSDAASLISKGLPLAGVMLAAFTITCISAVLMSWFNRRDKIEAALIRVDGMHDQEKKVDFDTIIETSVEERVAKAKKLEAMAPLQDDEMAPTVNRDNEINVTVDTTLGDAAISDVSAATAAVDPIANPAPVSANVATATVTTAASTTAVKEEKKEELPPLQDESMSPTVVHENGPKIQPSGGTSGLSGGVA